MTLPWTIKANKIFVFVLLLQLAIACLISAIHGSWIEPLLIGIPIVALPLVLISMFPNEAVTRHAVAAAVQLMTALHIQQTFGLTEMHFEIFVLLAFLSFYRDWAVILTSLLVVAAHHFVFFYLQQSGADIYLFQEDLVLYSILFIHAAFAAVESAVLIYVAITSKAEAMAALKLSNSVDEILGQDNYIDLGITIDTSDEQLKDFNRLLLAFREIIEQSKQVGSDVLKLSEHVETAAKGINESGSRNMEQVDLIATATEEMTVTNTDVAQRAAEASQHARDAQGRTINAKDIIINTHEHIDALKEDISKTAQTIDELATRCNHIDEVMAAIKTISDQTNLLALNAAIESARAGEHGRGFAVVADEVRTLAVKTRDNAEEISQVTSSLIADATSSVNQMHLCIDNVQQAVKASISACDVMDEVVGGIASVSDNIASVATATEEQSSVSDSIATSTQHLHTHTTEQKSSIEDSQHDLRELSGKVTELNHALARFAV